ncbi:RHS repeat-associated core domain-containing protein [Pseudomonas sp. v388]|uniref:RHS repeat-associated core domain-containing protein n=1 Tax=Pseudomonas sp. v388 TaxID=2479849 RepID=UPI0013159360|nr:RHS repeat-associated core domain-containing protein [Pseudomonas sp. v388]
MTPATPCEPQVAVVPLNLISMDDVGAGAARFETWLNEVSGGWVDLERIQLVAGTLPVTGNIMALVDALGDLASLAEGDAQDALLWASLGINLIGLLPAPGTAAARMSLRPMLALARQEMRRNPKGLLSDVLIEILIGHLNATQVGTLDDFIDTARKQIGPLLDEAGKLGVAMLNEIADGLVNAVDGRLDAGADFKKAGQLAGNAADQLLHDPRTSISNLFSAVGQASAAAGKGLVNQASRMLPDQARPAIARQAQALRDLGPPLLARMEVLKDVNGPHSVAGLVQAIATALEARRPRAAKGQSTHVKPGATTHATQVGQDGQLGMVSRQGPARQRARDDKNCVCPDTGNRISYALGSESFSHQDFSLPGPFPLDWSRTYDSRLDAFDQGWLGARWITPFTTRIERTKDGVRFHDADGRSHAWPLPKAGEFHFDAIESLTLIHVDAEQLVLCRGQASRETYMRHGEHYLLSQVVLRNGAGLLLRHAHQACDRPVLSELLTYQDDPTQVHRRLSTTIDDHGRITAVWEASEAAAPRRLCTYRYDAAGDLIHAEDEHEASREYRYQQHRVTRYTDRTGRGLNLEWQGDGPDAKAVREWADDGSFDTRLRWDVNIRLTIVTDALGQDTRHYYDELGYTYRTVHPDGRSEWLFRDAAKNVVRHVHPDGSTDRYRYDERSNLVQHIRADHSQVHYAYDDQDRLIKTRDAEGGLWLRDYDARGHLQETVDPLGHKTRYTNNAAGLPVSVEDAKGNKTRLEYNAAGQLLAYTDCSGKRSRWDYNALGQPVAFTDAQGQITRYEYQAGQLAKVLHPDQTEELFRRDAEGRLLAHVDPLGQRTHWSYSEAGLLTERIDAAHQLLRYHWDRLGRLVALDNENHRRTTFRYDPVGRLLRETGFDDRLTEYRYEEQSGTLASVVDGQRVVEVRFDPLGRLTERHAKLGSHTQRETFAYDGNGRLIQACNRESRLQWFFDAAGNLLREHQHYLQLNPPRVAAWRHEYDELNQRSATVRPDGHRVSWLTYGSGHLQALRLDEHDLLGYERDDLHREIARHQGNHLSQTQRWDPAGRLQEQWLGGKDATAFNVKRVYHYDAASQLTELDDSRRGHLSYQYDPVGRLLAAHSRLGQETFKFDPAGNLLQPTAWQRRPLEPSKDREALLDNVLRDYNGHRYEYDERGNQIRRWHQHRRSQLTWDLFDRLVGYSDERLSVMYAYDPLGRRLYKRARSHYHPDPAATDGWNQLKYQRQQREMGCDTYIYGWDGDQLAFEGTRERAGFSGRMVHYIYEPGTFIPVAQAIRHQGIDLQRMPDLSQGLRYHIDRDPAWQDAPEPPPFDALAWYHCDALGTPLELTDANGHLAWSAEYHAWGQVKHQRSAWAERHSLSNPLRFQGQYHDHETGLHYNRHRYYDPQVGRFISKDPIGLLGGLNLYAYAPNPVGWVDPFGLSAADGHAGRKPLSIKPNQNYKCPCKKWEISEYDEVCEGNVPGVGYAKYFYSARTEQWWSVDKTGHGGSAWKVFDEHGKWEKDADVNGNYMDKHKSNVGKDINFKQLKCRKFK